jgi:4-amino-4-deoxy-L-arabinose transferase-like glycosyltransferase
MTYDTRLDDPARGWRAPVFAALVALIAGLPGLLALPVLDRDEARFVQVTARMLETGDFFDIRDRDQTRQQQPLGPHWLQAASVAAVSPVEARWIWAYRIPSLLGAMLAAAACAWGASALFGPGAGMIAGSILGGCLILSTEAGIGKTDAMLCGATTLALAALGRLYGAANGAPAEGARTRALFWLGLTMTVLDKGPLGPLVVVLTGLTLWACDRRAPWARTLGWTWGLILFAALVGPWVAAATVLTDGQFWTGEPVFSLLAEHDGGGSPPGVHALAAPILLFPVAALLPAGLIEAWKARAEPGPRFALCWLVPGWLAFEATPLRLIHHALPLYGALAWMAAFALTRPLGRYARLAGAGLSILAAGLIATTVAAIATRYGDASNAAASLIACGLTVAAGVCGALIMAPRHRLAALAVTGALGIAAHSAIAAGLAPALKPLWLTPGVARVLDQSGLNPRDGLTPGPVTVVGYGEPSLDFELAGETEIGDVNAAAEAILEGRPVVIDEGDTAAFQRALAAGALKATKMGSVGGLDYSDGRTTVLDIYRSDSPPTGAGASALNSRSPTTSREPLHRSRRSGSTRRPAE